MIVEYLSLVSRSVTEAYDVAKSMIMNMNVKTLLLILFFFFAVVVIYMEIRPNKKRKKNNNNKESLIAGYKFL